MLERVLVCLLAGGHLLIEGVPGLAKTLTSAPSRDVLGGTFQRIQFTPDLVPADLVGTRIYRARRRRLRHRARPRLLQLPARRRDQPRARQGAVGAARGHAGAPGHDRRQDAPGPSGRSSCWRRRTRSSPRAPTRCPRRRSTASCSRCSSTTPPSSDELTVVQRALADPVAVQQVLELEELRRCRRRRATSTSTPRCSATPCRWPSPRASRRAPASATWRLHRVRREPARPDRPRARRPRAGPRARPPLRAARRTSPSSPPTSLRHRIVLTYEALAEGVSPTPSSSACSAPCRSRASSSPERGGVTGSPCPLAPRTPDRPGPGPCPDGAARRST